MTNKDELFYTLEASNYDDLPDGAWWQVLEDTVVWWNTENKTKYDPNTTVHEYLEWANKQATKK